jgi:hypothetical protein
MTFGLAPPKNVSTLFGIGSRVFLRLILFKLEWAFAWLFMLFGTTEMTMSNKTKKHFFLQLISMVPIGSICGLIFYKRSSEKRWILGATG